MYRLRRASAADLPAIYRMQDIPEREFILTSPLLPYAEFLTRAEREMAEGREFYCILERDRSAIGFLWISMPDETCEIWGRHLNTLFYACAWFAFEQLGMPRLNWIVRRNNRRMTAVCKRFRIRKTGDAFLFHIGEKFESMAVGNVDYFQFSSDEYFERIPLLQQYSLDRSIFSASVSDNLVRSVRHP